MSEHAHFTNQNKLYLTHKTSCKAVKRTKNKTDFFFISKLKSSNTIKYFPHFTSYRSELFYENIRYKFTKWKEWSKNTTNKLLNTCSIVRHEAQLCAYSVMGCAQSFHYLNRQRNNTPLKRFQTESHGCITSLFKMSYHDVRLTCEISSRTMKTIATTGNQLVLSTSFFSFHVRREGAVSGLARYALFSLQKP